MCTVRVDGGDGVAEVVRYWVDGGQDLSAGFDLHGAVAACGANKLF